MKKHLYRYRLCPRLLKGVLHYKICCLQWEISIYRERPSFKGHFSGPRYFFVIWWKRPEKILTQTHFSKNRTEMRKKEKSEDIRRYPKISEDCCATSCDVREGSCFESSEKRQWRVAENFLRMFYFLKSTNFYQINLFRASFPGKQVPSLTSEPTYFRAPCGLFRRLFLSFWKMNLRFNFL